METNFIKIGADSILRLDSIMELYISDSDGKLYIYTDNSVFDMCPAEHDVHYMFNKISEYLNIIETF